MTDHEAPEFKVVDKRRATSDGVASEREASSDDTTLETPGSDPAETQDSPRTDVPPVDESTEPQATEPKSAEEERGLPDPAMLFSYAAMQMDVRSLMRNLTAVFDGQAWRALGLVADPMTGEARKDLPAAQLAIDAVQFLLGKLESEMSDGERREVQRRLNDLRMNYLAKAREG